MCASQLFVHTSLQQHRMRPAQHSNCHLLAADDARIVGPVLNRASFPKPILLSEGAQSSLGIDDKMPLSHDEAVAAAVAIAKLHIGHLSLAASKGNAKKKRTKRTRPTTWRVHIDVKAAKSGISKDAFQGKIKAMGKVASLSTFEKQYGKLLDTLRRDIALRVFREDIEPVWEDPANTGRGAGAWTMVLPDEATSKAAFRAVLAEMMGPGLPGVNGVITSCKRGTHVLLLWTAADEGKDSYQMDALAERVSEKVKVPLKISFKTHAKKLAKNLGSTERAKTNKQPAKITERRRSVSTDSDYDSAPASKSSSPSLCGKEGPLELCAHTILN